MWDGITKSRFSEAGRNVFMSNFPIMFILQKMLCSFDNLKEAIKKIVLYSSVLNWRKKIWGGTVKGIFI